MFINTRMFLNKIFIGFVFIVSAFSSLVSAQNGWEVVRRGGSGDLVSVYFTSSEKGWVGGDDGYLAMTTDAGKNWKRQILNSKESVNEIYFRNDDNGYVLCGHRIFISKDGGKNWRENILVNTKEYNGMNPEFLSVRFIDKKRGWIVGSVSNQKDEVVDSLILQTLDSGESWARVSVPFKQEFYHLDFVDDYSGWIVGDKGLILTTSDGGATWTKQNSGVNVSLYNVDFRDLKTGIAVGGKGTILRTENGGATWVRVRTPETKSLLRVNFTDDKTGWIVGSGGAILRTDDRGKTWSKQDSHSNDSLYGLYMNKKNGWAVGKTGLVLKYQK